MNETQTVKHTTPGPWVVQLNAMSTPADAHCISPVEGGLPDVAWVNPDTPESEANARLIAAAPELLEALRETTYAFHVIGRHKGFSADCEMERCRKNHDLFIAIDGRS